MNYDQMSNMNYEDLVRHAQGLDQPQQTEQPQAAPQAQPEAAPAPQDTPAEEAAETPREERQEQQAQEDAAQQPAPDQAEVERQRQGNPAEALRQEREARRQEADRAARAEAEKQRIADEHAKLLKALEDPDRVEAHLRKIKPGPAPDFDVDPQGALEHHIAPLQEQLKATQAELAAMRQQAAHQAYMSRLAEKHGPQIHTLLPAFDAANPHLQNLDPEVRYLAALGIQAKGAPAPDPAAEEARIQALAAEKAKEIAAQQVANVLASGQAPKGIATLGSAPQAKQEQATPDLATMSYDSMAGKSPAELQAMLRNHYGG